MARDIHCVVQDAQDFDYLAVSGSIENEMTSVTPAARDMEGAKAAENFIARRAARRVRPGFKRGERLYLQGFV